MCTLEYIFELEMYSCGRTREKVGREIYVDVYRFVIFQFLEHEE